MRLHFVNRLRKHISFSPALSALLVAYTALANPAYAEFSLFGNKNTPVSSCKKSKDQLGNSWRYKECKRKEREYEKRILEDGGYVKGRIFVCKSLDFFDLRRPNSKQCWYLKSGTDVTVSSIGPKRKIKYGMLPWQTAYGDAFTCHQTNYDCIETHTYVK